MPIIGSLPPWSVSRKKVRVLSDLVLGWQGLTSVFLKLKLCLFDWGFLQHRCVTSALSLSASRGHLWSWWVASRGLWFVGCGSVRVWLSHEHSLTGQGLTCLANSDITSADRSSQIRAERAKVLKLILTVRTQLFTVFVKLRSFGSSLMPFYSSYLFLIFLRYSRTWQSWLLDQKGYLPKLSMLRQIVVLTLWISF